jgi:hypothetical protein
LSISGAHAKSRGRMSNMVSILAELRKSMDNDH